MNVRDAISKIDQIDRVRSFLNKLLDADWVIEGDDVVADIDSCFFEEIEHLLSEFSYLIEEMKVIK